MKLIHPGYRDRSGTVMMEVVLAFPLLLTLILGCIQFSHIWVARLVVNYAAYNAARAALVSCESAGEVYGTFTGDDPNASKRAAEQVCAWVIMGEAPGEVNSSDQVVLPGWGTVPGSGAVARKTRVTIAQDNPWNVTATVSLDFALITPIVGPMIAWGVDPWGRVAWAERNADMTGNAWRFVDSVEYPHIILQETVVMPKPYITTTPSDWPDRP